MTTSPDGPPQSLLDVGQPVDARLEAFLATERDRWSQVAPDLAQPIDALRALVMSGGKRLRPAFCYWGYLAAGGDPDNDAVIDAGAAIEMLHAFALIHDDIMDGSTERRGEPSTHVVFARHHEAQSWNGEAQHFGEAVGILVGDLAYAYADRLMAPRDPQLAEVWDELRIEVNIGQYLDVLAEARMSADQHRARLILEYKTGRYSVQRPLQIGAALAGALDTHDAALTAYGQPVGVAFQLRDDLLGAFGDPALTGKPVGDDLVKGKPTPLLAAAREAASPAQRELLEQVGQPSLDASTLAAIQEVIVDTGAAQRIDHEIGQLFDEALAALDAVTMPDEARSSLREIARFVAYRQH